ncbi:hypothetical protein JXD38_10050, partial [candidate division WOR-3 bacterium]|nr:hypothetical protein [candidate division WOR-3 bacterium]
MRRFVFTLLVVLLSAASAQWLPTGEFLVDTSITGGTALRDQSRPAVAFDGTSFLVVWEDTRCGAGSYDIFGVRVTPQGELLDPQNLAITTEDGAQTCPAVAFDGTNFVVVWQDQRNGDDDIYGARVTPSGTVLDPEGFAVSTAANDQAHPRIAHGNGQLLVVWEDYRYCPHRSDVFVARVTPGGAVLDPDGIAVSTEIESQLLPAAGFDGANFLVVWQDWRCHFDDDIYGARVTPGGAVLDPDGFAVCTTGHRSRSPEVAFDGANSLVVWQDRRNGDNDIYGARVTADGGVLDPDGICISRADNGQVEPAVAYDGSRYFVAWEDCRYDPDRPDVYGARVTTQGQVLDPEGIEVAPEVAGPACGFGSTS